MNIVLASSSVFRKEALDLLDIDYEVTPSEIDEQSITDSDPKVLAKKLADLGPPELSRFLVYKSFSD